MNFVFHQTPQQAQNQQAVPHAPGSIVSRYILPQFEERTPSGF